MDSKFNKSEQSELNFVKKNVEFSKNKPQKEKLSKAPY